MLSLLYVTVPLLFKNKEELPILIVLQLVGEESDIQSFEGKYKYNLSPSPFRYKNELEKRR